MVWLPILLLGLAVFAIAAFVLRTRKDSWTILAAVLVFGMAGYAWQGVPGMASSPKQATERQGQSGEEIVAARRALFESGRAPASYLMVSDGFARQGRYAEAAQLLRDGVNRNPGDAEAWLALANALVEHAEGQVTPAALHAYERAQQAFPAHPGAGYFLGTAFLRSNRLGDARQVWADLLARTPDDAPWREDLAFRINRLDELMAQMGRVQGMSPPPIDTVPSDSAPRDE